MTATTLLLLFLSPLLAFGLAAAAAPLVARLASRLGLLDVPGGRRRHPRPVPRPGGLAIALSFGATIFLFWLVDRVAGGPFLIPEEIRTPRFTIVAFAATIAVCIGFLDDLLDLRARWQFLGWLAVAALVVLGAGVRVEGFSDPFGGETLIALAPPLAILVSFFWIVGMNVALNFIDGLDGLAVGVSMIASATLGAIALMPQVNEPFVAWMQFTLAGACAGFLIFNFHPARLFMGTTGVAFVGTMLAVLSIFGTGKVAAALLVLGVPIIDTFYVLARRMVEGKPPFAPDRGHFHHRLLDIGLPHRSAVLLIYAITMALATVAVLTSGRAQLLSFIGAFVLLGIVVVVLTQRSPKAEELDPALYNDADG
ncbi:MAG TPA: MraY family glycosyltransferase [Candidatus Limnocylindria bacterium]|nr:MraY family glycosyltransferase [Candidatus Limnocylindria bacterium]